MLRSSTPFISVFWQQNCCWHKNSSQIFLLYETAAVFKCPNTRHRKLFAALFLPNAILRYNAHLSVPCLHGKVQETEMLFLKRSLVFQSCCCFMYCTLCNTHSFNSSCVLPTYGLVNFELLLLQTTYCTRKEKLFSCSRCFFFHVLILSSESRISWSWLWRDHWIQVCHLLSSKAALLEWDG